MPVPWVALPPIFTAPPPQIEWHVDAPTMEYDMAKLIYRYSDGVVGIYDQTKLTADRVELHRASSEEFLRADGHVLLVDPEGTLQAENLLYVWKKGEECGHAEKVFARVAGATIRAGSVDITPTLWTFHDVQGTSSRERLPLYEVRAKILRVVPGRRGYIQHPSLFLLGAHIIDLPTQRFNLDPRTQGIPYPSLSYHKDNGLGLNWSGGYLLSDSTAASFDAATFHNTLPSYGFQLSRSFLGAKDNESLITPQSDLRERFSYGYMDNIEVLDPVRELSAIRANRSGASIGTMWNQGASSLGNDLAYNKVADIAYERGGNVSGTGMYGQLRLQKIRQQNTSWITRGLLSTAIEPNYYKLGENLYGQLRLDGEGFTGGNNYFWVRSTESLFYRANKQIMLSGGLVQTGEGGTPDYTIDRPFDRNGFRFRTDFILGPTRFSYITKYDTQLKWYDHEYMVSQVAGPLRAFVVYRGKPNGYRLGLELRLDQFVDLLQNPRLHRDKPKDNPLEIPSRN